jgi:hypothetical protein
MKVLIKGLTPSVIAFSEVSVLSGAKLNLHGQVEAVVDLDTIQKENEVNVLVKEKLITSKEHTSSIEAPAAKPDPTTDDLDNNPASETEISDEDKALVIKNFEAGNITAKEALESVGFDPTQEITRREESTEDEPKKGRGRPKGSKNKNKNKKKDIPRTPVPELTQVVEDVVDAAEEAQDNSRAVVMTAGGEAVSSDMQNNMQGEMPESEKTKASLETMERLEAEENNAESFTEESKIDESEQDINNQMGNKATIGGAEGTTSVEMKSSILPEETNVKSDPFIDREEESEKEELDGEKAPFIPVDESKDDTFDPFIDSGVNANPEESDDILEL